MSDSTKEMDLEEAFIPTYAAQIQRWLPWLRMLRGFRMAIDPRRMFLALIAVWLWSAGEWVLSQQSFAPFHSQYAGPRTIWPGVEEAAFIPPILGTALPDHIPMQQPISQQTQWSLHRIFWPMLRAVPVKNLLAHKLSWNSWLFWSSTLLLGLGISALLGGAIARMTAVDFAGAGELSIRQGMRFSLRHWMSYLGAPLIACVGVTALWLFLLFCGLVASVPVVGAILVAILWIVLLLAGFAMALMLLGIGLGWPLMFAAISTESSDAFDGLSRSWSYVFNRPWYVLFLSGFMLIYGTALLMFVQGMVHLTESLTVGAFEVSYYGSENSTTNPRAEREFTPLNQLTGGIPRSAGMSDVAEGFIMFWTTGVLRAIPMAFVFSYFWTMVTIIYFLLRRREDATPLSEVALDHVPPADLPVVGIPAAELREKERSQNDDRPTEETGEGN